MAFRKVATLDDLWSGEMMALELEGQRVLLVNLNGCIRAYADSCPHLRTPLSQGSLQRNVLVCPTHGWQFDTDTGLGINPRTACLESFAVKLENGDIFVDADRVDADRVDADRVDVDRLEVLQVNRDAGRNA
jgi:toluene monooxygenase system ferredoxin subunit